jgi:outer membrane receptor protein involved in Fe transport
VPQQGNFDLWLWIPDDPETPRIGHYEFFDRFEVGGNTFRPNTDISPRKLDEITVGVERQLSNTLGVTVRYINRVWGDFVDDLVAFTPDGDLDRTVGNIDIAERSYRGFEVTLEKRFANQWSASGSYAFGHSEGNHFADDLTTLADFEGELCSSSDPGLALIACDDRLENLDGKPTFDRPHQFKFNGAYTRPIGMVDLTAGVVGAIASKATYSKTRTLEVLQDGISSGQTQTYFYEPRGSDRIDGMDFDLDLSVEAAVRTFERAQVGLKFDVFNLFNVQEKTAVSNTAWCNSTEGACGLERATYGTATSRGAFDAPTTIRFTFLVRWY